MKEQQHMWLLRGLILYWAKVLWLEMIRSLNNSGNSKGRKDLLSYENYMNTKKKQWCKNQLHMSVKVDSVAEIRKLNLTMVNKISKHSQIIDSVIPQDIRLIWSEDKEKRKKKKIEQVILIAKEDSCKKMLQNPMKESKINFETSKDGHLMQSWKKKSETTVWG